MGENGQFFLKIKFQVIKVEAMREVENHHITSTCNNHYGQESLKDANIRKFAERQDICRGSKYLSIK